MSLSRDKDRKTNSLSLGLTTGGAQIHKAKIHGEKRSALDVGEVQNKL